MTTTFSRFALALLMLAGLVAVTATIALVAASVGWAQDAESASLLDPSVVRWGFMSAATVAGLSTLAAGYAVAQVGSAAVGALAENPELLGRILILVGLAEGIAIYGLIVAVLIFNRLG